MSSAEVARIAALARVVHFGCVEVDGVHALRHRPEDHERVLAIAWHHASSSDRAALSGVPEGAASERGFAADRPNGPRTQVGHALASTLRRALPDRDTDWDQWVRDIEAAAMRSVPSPEPLDVERLARALHAMPHHYRGGADNDLARMACQQTSPSACEHKAASIAREYARLAASQPVPEDET